MKERLVHALNSLTAKYVAVFTLLVAVPAIGISWYLLDSSYRDNKAALIKQQQAQAQALAGRIDERLLDLRGPARLDPGSGTESRADRRGSPTSDPQPPFADRRLLRELACRDGG